MTAIEEDFWGATSHVQCFTSDEETHFYTCINDTRVQDYTFIPDVFANNDE